MEIESGDVFETTFGDHVRVSHVFDVYSGYDTDEMVGEDAETKVRYSKYWIEDRLLFGQETELATFLDHVDCRVDTNEVPDVNRPRSYE